MRPFRFAVTASWAASGAEWVAVARRAEALGYSALLMADHLGRQLSPIAALTAAAMATERLHVGSFVFANDYRHPLVLAREVATIHHLSGGRFELGLGAGWATHDYRQLGLQYDPPPVRIERFMEAVTILRRLLAGERVDYRGRHYHLEGARLAPLPPPGKRIPLLIGGGGPRILRFAAREADIVGFLPQFDRHGRPMVRQATEGATAAKAALVRQAAGDRFDQLDLNVIVFDAGLVDGPASPASRLSAAVKAAAVALVGTPYVLYGTRRRLRELLLRRREATGINYYAIPARVMEAMAPLVEDLAGR
jgi:probable F420-dependent oxidoreductase